MDGDDVDLLERARACDREAYRALVGLWGDAAYRTAVMLTGDRAAGGVAARDAFLAAWTALPALHTEGPFRPWLLGHVVRAAGDVGTDHAAAVLHRALGLGTVEVGLALGLNPARAARLVRSVRARAIEQPVGLELPPTFFDEALAPALADPVVSGARRIVASDPEAAWGAIADPASVPAWAGEEVRGRADVRPGARFRGHGRIAGARPSNDEIVVTRAERPSLLAWTMRAAPIPLRAAIELRLSLSVADGEIALRLHGVAFPPPPAGAYLRRVWRRHEPAFAQWLHRRLEEVSTAVEARAKEAR